MKHVMITIKPVPPYDFDLTADYATYFSGQYGADSFRKGVFRRLLEIRDHLCLVSVRSTGTLESPRLEAELSGPELEETIVMEAQHQLEWMLGTEQDLSPFYSMALRDSTLEPLARGLCGLHIPHTISVFEALVMAILGQQISSNVARMLRTLVIQKYGPAMSAYNEIYSAFPSPGALLSAGVEGLRSIKISGRKAEYIVGIAEGAASGALELENLRTGLDDDAVRTLIEIRGVGLWTAQWLLIRALGSADGFPYDDLALRRFLGLLLKNEEVFNPKEALKYSERWSPFRSYVTTYLFAAARSGKLS